MKGEVNQTMTAEKTLLCAGCKCRRELVLLIKKLSKEEANMIMSDHLSCCIHQDDPAFVEEVLAQ